jgi:hypothetical protein
MDDLNETKEPEVAPAPVEPVAEAAPAPVERVIPKRVLVRKSDAAIEVEIRDTEHYDALVAIHGVGSLEALS